MSVITHYKGKMNLHGLQNMSKSQEYIYNITKGAQNGSHTQSLRINA